MPSIWINNVPIEEIGLTLADGANGSPVLNGFERERQSLAWPGMTGHIPSRVATTKPRELVFVFNTARTMTLAERQYLLRYFSDLFTGLQEVRFDDNNQPRRIMGYCSVYDAAVASPQFVNIAPKITVKFTFYNAAFEDVECSHYAIGTVPKQMPVGTVGHGGQLFLTGAVSTPVTVTYRNIAGTVLGQLSFTPTLAAGESLIIDLDARQWLKVSTTNVRTSVPTWNTNSVWFFIMPRDCNREMGVMPTLEASTAMLFRFRLRWEN